MELKGVIILIEYSKTVSILPTLVYDKENFCKTKFGKLLKQVDKTN